MKLAPPQKRGAVRAVIGGIAAHYLVFGALFILYWAFRPFVWAALYSVPYPPPQGPYDPSSGEWLFVQAMGFLSWVGAGAATARWSNPGFPWVLVAFGVLCLALPLFAIPIENVAIPRLAIYYLGSAVGLACGAVAYARSMSPRESKHDT
jgi:hypothetical protein